MFNKFVKWYAERKFKETVSSDRFFRESILYVNNLLNDHNVAENNEVARLLQNSDEEIRKDISNKLSNELMKIVRSENRIMACRIWIHEILLEYSWLRALTLDPSEVTGKDSPYYHPCILGLYDKIEDIVKASVLPDFIPKGNTVENTIKMLLNESRHHHIYLTVADFFRKSLGDFNYDPPDWFVPYCNSRVAWAEIMIRGKMGFPIPHEPIYIVIEAESFTNNLLEGKENPLDGVDFVS